MLDLQPDFPRELHQAAFEAGFAQQRRSPSTIAREPSRGGRDGEFASGVLPKNFWETGNHCGHLSVAKVDA